MENKEKILAAYDSAGDNYMVVTVPENSVISIIDRGTISIQH